jgi:hypothetical protein
MFDHVTVIDAGADGTSSAVNSSNTQANPKSVPKANTALEASKLALNALDSASSFLPHGAVLSVAIKGVLTAIDVVEVSRCTTSYLIIQLNTS